MHDEPVLELSDATVVKNGVRILDGLTLSIRAGEHTAIVGPNGSGKSTLINVLTQQDHALAREDGTPPVRVFGESLWRPVRIAVAARDRVRRPPPAVRRRQQRRQLQRRDRGALGVLRHAGDRARRRT